MCILKGVLFDWLIGSNPIVIIVISNLLQRIYVQDNCSLRLMILLGNSELLGVREGLGKVFKELGACPGRYHRALVSAFSFPIVHGPEVNGFTYIPTIVFCLLQAQNVFVSGSLSNKHSPPHHLFISHDSFSQ